MKTKRQAARRLGAFSLCVGTCCGGPGRGCRPVTQGSGMSVPRGNDGDCRGLCAGRCGGKRQDRRRGGRAHGAQGGLTPAGRRCAPRRRGSSVRATMSSAVRAVAEAVHVGRLVAPDYPVLPRATRWAHGTAVLADKARNRRRQSGRRCEGQDAGCEAGCPGEGRSLRRTAADDAVLAPVVGGGLRRARVVMSCANVRSLGLVGRAVCAASPGSLGDRGLRPSFRADVSRMHAGPCPSLRDTVDVQGRGKAWIKADADGVLPKAHLRKNPPDHLALRRRIEAARSEGALERPPPYARPWQTVGPWSPGASGSDIPASPTHRRCGTERRPVPWRAPISRQVNGERASPQRFNSEIGGAVMQEQFVGVDVSKDALDVCLWPSQTQLRIGNRQAEIKRWLKSLPSGTRIAMESTGAFHQLLAELARQAGMRAYVLNPKRVWHRACLCNKPGNAVRTHPIRTQRLRRCLRGH